MKALTLILVILISAMAFGQSTNPGIKIKVSETHLVINYSEDGRSKTINEAHKIPIQKIVLGEAGVSNLEKDPNKPLKAHSMNFRMLDSLIWRRCNVFRTKNNIAHAKWDESIHRASKHHSYYQKQIKGLQHGETQAVVGRKEQQDHYRNVYRGAAEICLYNYLSLNRTTYVEAADMIVKQWIGSPGHNAIMRSKSYAYNAFGTVLALDHNHLVNSHFLKKFNPELYATIQSKVPSALEKMDNSSARSSRVYSTGNFTWGQIDGKDGGEVAAEPLASLPVVESNVAPESKTTVITTTESRVVKKKPAQNKGKLQRQANRRAFKRKLRNKWNRMFRG
jgi:uncharacterized protein YkwD